MAKEILEQQRQNKEELQRLKSWLADKSAGQSLSIEFNKGSSTHPEFSFEGNKQQQEINYSVIGHFDCVLDSSNDQGEIQCEISKSNKLLMQRNKHTSYHLRNMSWMLLNVILGYCLSLVG